jgi:hypothetical protein
MSAYTPPATFTASACHIAHTDDEPTNHFTADCPAVSANGAACTLTLTSGYEVSTPLHAKHHRCTKYAIRHLALRLYRPTDRTKYASA